MKSPAPSAAKPYFLSVEAAALAAVEVTPLSLAALTRLLRTLLEEGVPIGHPLPILASLSQAVQVTVEHERLVDIVRADLGGLIVGRICSPGERLPVLTLDASLEQAIVQGLHDPTTGQPVIEPELARAIGERVAAAVASQSPGSPPPALIVQPRARRALASLLRLRAPACTVLSIAELPAAQPIEVLAVIGGDARTPEPPALSPPIPDHSEELAA